MSFLLNLIDDGGELFFVVLLLFEHHLVFRHILDDFIGEQSAFSLERLNVGDVLDRVFIFVVLKLHNLFSNLF